MSYDDVEGINMLTTLAGKERKQKMGNLSSQKKKRNQHILPLNPNRT